MSPDFPSTHKTSCLSTQLKPQRSQGALKRLNYNLTAKLIATLNLESIGVSLRQRQMTCLQKHWGLKNYLPETRSEPIHETRLKRFPVSYSVC